MLAEAVPTQPVHPNSLFELMQSVLVGCPEGQIWLVVYDLKALMQQLNCFLTNKRLKFFFDYNSDYGYQKIMISVPFKNPSFEQPCVTKNSNVSWLKNQL